MHERQGENSCEVPRACAGDLHACEVGCSRVLEDIREYGCSGLRALVLTQRAACRLLHCDADCALADCCAALLAEPGSPDAHHLKFQARHPCVICAM